MVALFKIVLILLILFILLNLGFALFQMVKESNNDSDKNKKPMSHYLGRRVIFSAAVIVLLLIALATGWIDLNPRPY